MTGNEYAIGRSTMFTLIFLLLSGCASMMAPSSDFVTINTVPQGAEVYLGDELLGKTPVTHVFKRQTFEKKTLSIRKKGYKTRELLLETALESTALLNLGFITTTSGVTSWGIDASSGNMIKYHPGSYLIDLEKEGEPSRQKEHASLLLLRFVARNQAHLQSDIAFGDGEYLRAYYEIRSQTMVSGDYQVFLRNVSRSAPHLLTLNDPVAFFTSLEII